MNFSSDLIERFSQVKRVRDDMHVYQDEGVDFLLANPFSALFIDMGLGKTIISLTCIADLIAHTPIDEPDDKILIIGPRRVATQTWPNEIPTWQHTAWLDFQVVHCFDDDPRLAEARRAGAAEARGRGLSSADVTKAGQAAETRERERIRRVAARSKKQIHIISRDWVEWLVNFWGPKWPYRTVFIDESSGFKSHTSERFKALKKTRNTPGLITRLHLLTATPATEGYIGFFSQVYLLDKGERFSIFVTHYQKEYFTQNKYSRKWELRPGADEAILDKMADICLVMKAEDYLDVEKPTIVPYPVYLDQKSLDLYNEMEEEFIVTLDDGTEVEAETAAALSAKLLQIASGVLYDTKFIEDWDTDDLKKVKTVHHVHNHKIEALEDIVESAQGEPIIVVYHFKSSLAALKKAFPHATVMDADGKCVKKWNKGKIPMLLMHPQSGGHGLNMQDGGHHMVMYDIPWSLELFIQVIGRLARQGQKHHVVVRLLTAMKTKDEFVWECLSKKTDAQDKMFAMLKRKIKAFRERRKREQIEQATDL